MEGDFEANEVDFGDLSDFPGDERSLPSMNLDDESSGFHLVCDSPGCESS